MNCTVQRSPDLGAAKPQDLVICVVSQVTWPVVLLTLRPEGCCEAQLKEAAPYISVAVDRR